MPMRNVIVFAVDRARYAVELRWVREIVTLGQVTPVPGAPAHVVGATALHGGVIPVLDVGALAPAEGERVRPAATRSGDGVILIDVDGVLAALRMTGVEAITSLATGAREPGGVLGGAVVDAHDVEVPLLDPLALVRQTMAMARTQAGPARAGGSEHGR